MYNIWIQRNNRVHNGVIKTEEQLVRDICKDVKARMATKRPICNSILNRMLYNNWELSWSVMSKI